MPIFRIIPVIDILNSEAVHAIKGERSNYRPLKSIFTESSDPFNLIKILKNETHLNEYYIADLDAIIKKKPNFNLLLKISNISEIKIILDPGIFNEEDLLHYSKIRLNKLILGLESIDNFNLIKNGLEILGSDKIIVSIDMFKEKLVSNISEIKNKEPFKVINELEKLGVKELIVLDLFRVGQKLGGIPPVYLKIRHRFSGNILAGGGIRDLNDIKRYYKKKFSGVLIATALYDGTINIKKIKNLCN